MAKNVILSIFAMSKSNDKVINEMRKITTCKSKHINLLSLLALASALNHLQTLENPNLSRDFIQIICRPINFGLSYEHLAHLCYYNEKSLRLHAKKYTSLYKKERKDLADLPLPLLISELIRYKSSAFINAAIPSLRTLTYSDMPALLAAYPAAETEKQLSLLMIDHFGKAISRIAI